MSSNHVLREELLETNYNYRKLHHQHEQLEEEIRQVNLQPYVDIIKLKRLKRTKLLVADSMERLL